MSAVICQECYIKATELMDIEVLSVAISGIELDCAGCQAIISPDTDSYYPVRDFDVPKGRV